ncbi:MAG: ABC transporter permease subunit [Lachnospiraceae bacterium]|nr:ABC transporter permease subunit [Lachnospiraceae bacterium]
MRVFRLELKKILKSRRTIILIALSLFMSVLMAYLPVTFVSVSQYDEAGNKVASLKGLEAVRYTKILQEGIKGELTPEIMRHAVEEYQACMREYNAEGTWDLPGDVYYKRIFPIYPLLPRVREAFSDRKTGFAPAITDIAPEKVDNFYEACDERIIALGEMEQKNSQAARQFMRDKYRSVEKPYFYYPGYNSDAMDYELLLAILLLLFCTVIAAPAFSSDYQTGADDILRCTRHGRMRLGISKTATVAGISGILYTVCMTIYLLLSNSFFGWECTRTSMQVEYSVTSLANWNMGELQLAVMFAGLLTVIATVCFTAFLSSRCRNVITSLSIGLVMCFAPIFIYMSIPDSFKPGLWMRCMLPSGGLGMMSSFLYSIIDYEFLTLGSLAVWTPYAMAGFAAVEIVIFSVTAVRSYMVHRVA